MPSAGRHQPTHKCFISAGRADPSHQCADDSDDPRNGKCRPEAINVHPGKQPCSNPDDQRLADKHEQQDANPAQSHCAGHQKRLHQQAGQTQHHGELEWPPRDVGMKAWNHPVAEQYGEHCG
jgi:hypothetical protein